MKQNYICAKSKPQNQMKKILLTLSAACFMFIVACGPSAEEQAAEAKRVADSTAAAIQHVNDSIAAEQQKAMEQMKADSTAAANAAKAVQDSIDASKKKPSAKKTNEQKMKEDKKVLTKQKG
jgi:hypothetical protein